MTKSTINVALVGNPNTGKTSLFNSLTGLQQKVGNYPGITVEKKKGSFNFDDKHIQVIDLPGTYSLNPTSIDESVATDFLIHSKNTSDLDVVVVVTEVENLKRNLLLFTQVKDLGIPTILVINMSDRMSAKGISIDIDSLQKKFDTNVILLSTRKNTGIENLKLAIVNFETLGIKPIIVQNSENYIEQLHSTYNLGITKDATAERLSQLKKEQHQETVKRYQYITNILKTTYQLDASKADGLDSKLDKILTHRFFGYIIFIALLLIMFQAIFAWSGPMMDWIDVSFSQMASAVSSILPEGKLSELITEGIIPGIGGVVIFVPQIVILFLFIALLEESGYMSRVVFLMDKIMRQFGLNGKSIVPLISGNACAIPAVMSTRNIEDWKERLITILVTPFTVCSARLPVYTILISLIVPEGYVYGIFNIQALALLGMYILGIILAIGSAMILNQIIRMKSKTYFVIEMPTYKIPLFKNIFYTVVEKTKAFVINAGKIILAISIILWFLGSHGGDKFDNAEQHVSEKFTNTTLTDEEFQTEVASFQLENSYIGMIGKTIEPVIKPLGYDWKIGIAILTSFAAREVFVGTLATLYSVEDPEDESTIRERMQKATFSDTGAPVYTVATGVSLLLFYAIAMQCGATVATVKRETNSWKWALAQLLGMGVMAYLFAWIGFILFK